MNANSIAIHPASRRQLRTNVGRAITVAVRSRMTVIDSARGFLALFGIQVTLNVLVVAQERAAATMAFGPSFVSNLLLAGVSYLAVRQVVKSRSPALGLGYALGGGVGGIVGLYAARLLGI